MSSSRIIGGAGALLLVLPAFAGEPVVFVFDQTLDAILRVEDINGDGDSLEAGEVLRFFDDTVPVTGTENSIGLHAFTPRDILATDNFAPDNIVRLRDLNNDGDAFDATESKVWFSGALPGGFTMTLPFGLLQGPDGAFYLLQNNFLDPGFATPCAFYRLEDVNDDDDVDDAGEVTQYFQLSPPGTGSVAPFDLTFDDDGALYFFDIATDIESIDRINPAATAKTEWLTSSALFSLSGFTYLFGSTYALDYDPVRDEVLATVIDNPVNAYIFAFKDRNNSGTINAANEYRIVWSDVGNADGVSTGTVRDLHRLPDGSIVFVEAFNDQVVHLVDLNADGDYLDLNETNVIYSAAAAGGAGQPSAPLMLSCFGIVPCPADFNLDGNPNTDDFIDYLVAYASGSARADVANSATLACDSHDGNVNTDDFICYLSLFASGCP